jgi:hypothetical protein
VQNPERIGIEVLFILPQLDLALAMLPDLEHPNPARLSEWKACRFAATRWKIAILLSSVT